jgi:outer membrane protein assembly factor BamB
MVVEHRFVRAPAALGMAMVLGSFCCTAGSAEWPQFRGPNRDGMVPEQAWLAKWPEGGPKVLWKASVGEGYSGMAVSGGRLFTMGHAKQAAADGRQEDFDVVWCLDAATGKQVWKHAYRCAVASYYGPFATPTVDSGFVFTLSQFGHLHCLEASSGKVVWSTSTVDDLRGKRPYYGYACSPLVAGEVVVVETSGEEASLVALDKRTGQVAWRYGKGEAGYSTPVAGTFDGQACVVALTPAAVFAVKAATGQEVWRHPWRASPQSTATAPLLSGDKVFVAASESKKTGLLLQVTGRAVSVVWQGQNMLNYFNASVVHDGHLYGVHSLDHLPKNSTLRCVNFLTGEVKWDRDGLGLASVVLVGRKLLVLTDRGELVLADAAPEAFKELARAKVLDGNCWTSPVPCDGRVYCRNHRGEIVCLDVTAQ